MPETAHLNIMTDKIFPVTGLSSKTLSLTALPMVEVLELPLLHPAESIS